MWTDQKCATCATRLREKQTYYNCTSNGACYFYRIYCPRGCANHGGKS